MFLGLFLVLGYLVARSTRGAERKKADRLIERGGLDVFPATASLVIQRQCIQAVVDDWAMVLTQPDLVRDERGWLRLAD